jgi:hypothetical protein
VSDGRLALPGTIAAGKRAGETAAICAVLATAAADTCAFTTIVCTGWLRAVVVSAGAAAAAPVVTGETVARAGDIVGGASGASGAVASGAAMGTRPSPDGV